ncbi:hypothetical protein Mapa_004818 [Marchantia paleacea]|nr:hypothetical protein Mapa_004818 [Marchantia paleacea]
MDSIRQTEPASEFGRSERQLQRQRMGTGKGKGERAHCTCLGEAAEEDSAALGVGPGRPRQALAELGQVSLLSRFAPESLADQRGLALGLAAGEFDLLQRGVHLQHGHQLAERLVVPEAVGPEPKALEARVVAQRAEEILPPEPQLVPRAPLRRVPEVQLLQRSAGLDPLQNRAPGLQRHHVPVQSERFERRIPLERPVKRRPGRRPAVARALEVEARQRGARLEKIDELREGVDVEPDALLHAVLHLDDGVVEVELGGVEEVDIGQLQALQARVHLQRREQVLPVVARHSEHQRVGIQQLQLPQRRVVAQHLREHSQSACPATVDAHQLLHRGVGVEPGEGGREESVERAGLEREIASQARHAPREGRGLVRAPALLQAHAQLLQRLVPRHGLAQLLGAALVHGDVLEVERSEVARRREDHSHMPRALLVPDRIPAQVQALESGRAVGGQSRGDVHEPRRAHLDVLHGQNLEGFDAAQDLGQEDAARARAHHGHPRAEEGEVVERQLAQIGAALQQAQGGLELREGQLDVEPRGVEVVQRAQQVDLGQVAEPVADVVQHLQPRVAPILHRQQLHDLVRQIGRLLPRHLVLVPQQLLQDQRRPLHLRLRLAPRRRRRLPGARRRLQSFRIRGCFPSISSPAAASRGGRGGAPRIEHGTAVDLRQLLLVPLCFDLNLGLPGAGGGNGDVP